MTNNRAAWTIRAGREKEGPICLDARKGWTHRVSVCVCACVKSSVHSCVNHGNDSTVAV